LRAIFETRGRERERLGRVCRGLGGGLGQGWGRGLGSSTEHPRETPIPSLGAGGRGKREEGGRLWRRIEITEK